MVGRLTEDAGQPEEAIGEALEHFCGLPGNVIVVWQPEDLFGELDTFAGLRDEEVGTLIATCVSEDGWLIHDEAYCDPEAALRHGLAMRDRTTA